MKYKQLVIALLCSPFLCSFSQADDLVMITSTDNTENIDVNDVARIFLGKVTTFPSGEEVVPLDIKPSDPSYEEFARVVLNKSVSQMRAYWAKRTFTGKGSPPLIIDSVEELRDLVSSDKKYLSYLDSENVNHTVRWVIVIDKDPLP